MSIRMYNTLTRSKEVFRPLQEKQVNMYVCGPTVYNHIHIGNARPAIFFDTLRRYLEYSGFQVTYVHNFTDVDDKIIAAAQREEKSAQEIAQTYMDAYYDVLDQLGVRRADVHPKVTDHIDDIIDFIQALMDKGFAYEAGGDVYFRTERFAEYGKLSQQQTNELLEGVRVTLEEHKKSAIDFTLWKRAKAGEVAWDSPWGSGRPGWHIECSTLIKKYLGESIDIHGGGIDLSFPHHENEIAQTESLTGQPLARYWLHNAMLTIDEEKMSKSLGNFIHVKDVLANHDPQVVRFFMLNGHYRTVLNYSEDSLAQAGRGFERLKTAASNWKHMEDTADPTLTSEETHDRHLSNASNKIAHYRRKFEEEMNDDLNTADALSVIFEYIRDVNIILQETHSPREVALYRSALLEWADILGFRLQEDQGLLDEDVERLIEERTQARKDKNFTRADEIRDHLEAQGIVLEDTRQGVRWRRK